MNVGAIQVGTKKWHESLSEIFDEMESLIGVLGITALIGLGFLLQKLIH